MKKVIEFPKLPIRHISLRVPWHDAGWDGTVCKSPGRNVDCLVLPNVYENRDDEKENENAGRSILNLKLVDWPPCIAEGATFMAGFEFTRQLEHPYVRSDPQDYGHLRPTPFRHPPYSATAIPFRWMLKSEARAIADEYDVDFDERREEELGLRFESDWVNEFKNQKAMLNRFFEFIVQDKSLCFFYAKRVPFVDDNRRVIIGVGRLKGVGRPVEYDYEKENPLVRALAWPRLIYHSIRPGFEDGFILPYHKLMQELENGEGFDPEPYVALVPDEYRMQFSYGAEHVSDGAAIAVLQVCRKAVEATRKRFEGSWDKVLGWINDRFGELWRMRGPYPGLGAVLSAFGVKQAHFVAWEIAAKVGEGKDPWPLVEKVFENPKKYLPDSLKDKIGDTLRRTWAGLSLERKTFLKLMSRFDLTQEQAKRFFDEGSRHDAGIELTDADFIKNPYLFYESDRFSPDPIGIWVIDQGIFPPPVIRDRFPLPEPSRVTDEVDVRRVRAFTVNVLEEYAVAGHTLQPVEAVVRAVRDFPIDPPCPVTMDIYRALISDLSPAVREAKLADGKTPAYQLGRFGEIGEFIREKIIKRVHQGKRHKVEADWSALLKEVVKGQDIDAKAAKEKIAALEELAASRFAVVVGPAGTGKTTLVAALCRAGPIRESGILLLAPTGKARVRLWQLVGLPDLKAYTIAQFLTRSERYDVRTGRYRLRPGVEPYAGAKTVIVDEASMLTEEMFAALLENLRGVERLILVGDPNQLPPIGAGRPFVDIVAKLRPEDIEEKYPRVAPAYVELTVLCRHRPRAEEDRRDDLALADWFGGAASALRDEDVFHRLARARASHIRFENWETPEDLQNKLLGALVEELQLKGRDDEIGFAKNLGAEVWQGNEAKTEDRCYFNIGAGQRADRWQVLTPRRGGVVGASFINFLIHSTFYKSMIERAVKRWNRDIPKPFGPERIVYGEKVINVINHVHNRCRPPANAAEPLKYVANGEIGVVVGECLNMEKRKKYHRAPNKLKVEFSSQPGVSYEYGKGYFPEDGDIYLERAYALTVHKAQGSDFDLVILVIPEPCRLLSRELLYTALTRQKDRVVILYQGDIYDLKRYSSANYSETAGRLTNLFEDPDPVEVEVKPGYKRVLDGNRVFITENGELVASKSEVIIANALRHAGIQYYYEKPFKGKDGRVVWPDFTIVDDDRGVTYFWEHRGLLSLPDYAAKWESKKQWYRENGVIPYEERKDDTTRLLVATKEDTSTDWENIYKLINDISSELK